MKKILILAFTDLRHDARIARQIEFLKNSYQVTVVCIAAHDSPGFEPIIIKRTNLTLLRKAMAGILLLLRQYSRAHELLFDYGYVKKLLGDRTFDVVIANDIESLPFAFGYAPAKVIFDAHEYAPRHFEDKLIWRIFFQPMNVYLCKEYIHRTSAMMTVGRDLATEYEKNFKVKPLVITNASPYVKGNPLPVDSKKIKLIHHGGANPSRKLELMIEMVALLDDRFSMDMMLITPPIANRKTKAYLDQLKDLASRTGRVRILPPVKSSEIIGVINQYDIGVFIIPPINFNYAHTLPNKLFDFIQARLAIAIGPTPEMAEIVNKYEIGVVAEDFTPASLAEKLNALTEADLHNFKERTERAALELNAEANKKLVLELVESVIR